MITIKKAAALAEEYLYEKTSSYFVLLPELTQEFSLGWVFFYQTKQYIDSGDLSQMSGENPPIIINKTNGSVHITGTDLPVEKYIRDYIKAQQL